MTAAPALWAVGQDTLWCLGLGLLLAGVRDLAGLAVGNGRLLSFLWDVLAFAAAAVLLCGFTASASAGGVTRWYMAAGLGAGALAWRWAISGMLHSLARRVSDTCRSAILRLQRVLAAPFIRVLHRCCAKNQKKREEKAKKASQKVTKRKKQLQNQRKILYN